MRLIKCEQFFFPTSAHVQYKILSFFFSLSQCMLESICWLLINKVVRSQQRTTGAVQPKLGFCASGLVYNMSANTKCSAVLSTKCYYFYMKALIISSPVSAIQMCRM
jgi:hypothetical protein